MSVVPLQRDVRESGAALAACWAPALQAARRLHSLGGVYSIFRISGSGGPRIGSGLSGCGRLRGSGATFAAGVDGKHPILPCSVRTLSVRAASGTTTLSGGGCAGCQHGELPDGQEESSRSMKTVALFSAVNALKGIRTLGCVSSSVTICRSGPILVFFTSGFPSVIIPM